MKTDQPQQLIEQFVPMKPQAGFAAMATPDGVSITAWVDSVEVKVLLNPEQSGRLSHLLQCRNGHFSGFDRIRLYALPATAARLSV
jgi:hypothetical protein